MNITCLITTYKLSADQIIKLLNEMNLFCPTILRNQTDDNSQIETIINNQKVTVINAKDSGLSKNRNELLKLVNSDYVFFADDDEKFYNNTESIVLDSFEQTNCDAIVFNYNVINKKRDYKHYLGKPKRCKKRQLMSTGVVRFVFKTKSIMNLKFDEKIGSGTKYLCGEDSLFINNYLKKTKRVYFNEKIICTIDQTTTLWKNKILSKEYLHVKGYVYKKIYGILYPFVCIRFLLKSRRFNLENLREIFKGYKIISKT